MSAYLEGTDEKNAEARFYKGVDRRPVEKFKSIQCKEKDLIPVFVSQALINASDPVFKCDLGFPAQRSKPAHIH